MAKLASRLLVSSYIRRAETEGGTGVVLAKGDATAGSILILTREKGAISALWERILSRDSGYHWAKAGPQVVDNVDEIEQLIARKRARDPDLWVIELDIPDAERFIADLVEDA
jgi:hypothetical protein